jgi:hypothetical protein
MRLLRTITEILQEDEDGFTSVAVRNRGRGQEDSGSDSRLFEEAENGLGESRASEGKTCEALSRL